MIATFVVVGVLGCSSPVSAQCNPPSSSTSNANVVDVSWYNGSFRAYAFTNLQDCYQAYVEVWIDAVPTPTCGQGSFLYGSPYSTCGDNSTTTTAIARAAGSGCGQTSAHGGFWLRQTQNDPGLWEWFRDVGLNVTCYTPPEGCEEANMFWNPATEQWECDSPIIIATGKDQKYKLTDAAGGVLFDLNGDGILDQISWTEAGSEVAFLAIDRNGNGKIDDGRELLGNFTVPGASNGFVALAELAFAESGVRRGDISSVDPIYARLLLWTDTNHNGQSEPNELRPFSEQFSAIGLSYLPHKRKDGNGNTYAFQGYVLERTKPGRNPTESQADLYRRHRKVYDVFLVR